MNNISESSSDSSDLSSLSEESFSSENETPSSKSGTDKKAD